MPLLDITTTEDLDAAGRRRFARRVAETYAEHMETGTDHVAVAFRRARPGDLWLGRAADPPPGGDEGGDGAGGEQGGQAGGEQGGQASGEQGGDGAGLLFLDADVRAGRSHEQRRGFALAFMDLAAERLGLPGPNMKVAFTEHDGEQLMGYHRVGSDWQPGEAE